MRLCAIISIVKEDCVQSLLQNNACKIAHDSGGSGFLFINVCCAAIDSLKNKSNKTRKA